MEVSLSELYQLEDREHSSDNSGDNSPSSTTFTTSISSSPKRRRSIQKRVVTVPIKDIEGSRFKGDCTPPSDSWAWRKYGQKPIKGSPYPRGYYRCSSSKGCPARKQVEKSRSDPSKLIITYSFDHNHPWPTTRNQHQNRHTAANTSTTTTLKIPTTTTTPITTPDIMTSSLDPNFNPKLENPEDDQIYSHPQGMDPSGNHSESQLLPPTDDFWWFPLDHYPNQNHNHHHHQIPSDHHSVLTNCTLSGGDLDMAKIFPIEEEDSLFADLGELPECSVVFRQAVAAGGEKQRRWCGTMS